MNFPQSGSMSFRGATLLAASWLSACSTTTVVKRGKPFVLEKKAVVVLREGPELQARRVAVEADSLAVIGRYTGAEIRFPLHAVRKVAELDAFSGMLRGAGNGFWIGAGAGLALGAITDGSCSENCYIPLVIVMPILGVIWTTPLGAAYGLLRGRGASYRFEDGRDPESASSPNTSIISDSTAPSHVSFLPSDSSSLSPAEWTAREAIAKDSTRAAHRTQPRNMIYAGATGSAAFGSPPSGPGKAPPVTFGDGGPQVSLSLGANLHPRWMAGLRYTTGFLEQQYRTSAGTTNFRESHLNEVQAEAFLFPLSVGPDLRGRAGHSR
jgi:hypothetical protein